MLRARQWMISLLRKEKKKKLERRTSCYNCQGTGSVTKMEQSVM